jgi:hypothetical protein
MTSGIRVVLLVVLSMMWAVERSTKVSRGKYSCNYVSFVYYCPCLDFLWGRQNNGMGAVERSTQVSRGTYVSIFYQVP